MPITQSICFAVNFAFSSPMEMGFSLIRKEISSSNDSCVRQAYFSLCLIATRETNIVRERTSYLMYGIVYDPFLNFAGFSFTHSSEAFQVFNGMIANF